MKYGLVRKGMILGIILLFVGVSIIPSMSGAVFEKKSNHPISNDGNTLYVGGSGEGNYTSIQDAIDNANSGDTVFVYDDSSPYHEHVKVNKSIKLIGEDKDNTIIDGNGNGTVILLYSASASRVTISGFTIQNGENGISLDVYTNSNTINDNIIIFNYENGISLNGSSRNTIKDNNINSNENRGISLGVAPGGFPGIVRTSDFNIIKGNIISKNNDGIYLDGCVFNLILKNYFLDNERDAYFKGSILNRWIKNYWNKPRILPKLIHGEITIEGPGWPPSFILNISWFNIDWRPALLPHKI